MVPRFDGAGAAVTGDCDEHLDEVAGGVEPLVVAEDDPGTPWLYWGDAPA
jgi:hypothetical protein